MAKRPIELCLELKGEDAIEFQKYMENPVDTPEGRELMKEAANLAKQKRLEEL